MTTVAEAGAHSLRRNRSVPGEGCRCLTPVLLGTGSATTIAQTRAPVTAGR